MSLNLWVHIWWCNIHCESVKSWNILKVLFSHLQSHFKPTYQLSSEPHTLRFQSLRRNSNKPSLSFWNWPIIEAISSQCHVKDITKTEWANAERKFLPTSLVMLHIMMANAMPKITNIYHKHQKAPKKAFNITSHPGKSKSKPPHQLVSITMATTKKIWKCVGEDVEKQKGLCTVKGNAKWCSCFGK